MANYLGPGHGSDLASQTSSAGPSSRPSYDEFQSHEGLLPRASANRDREQVLGDSVPDAPPRVQAIPAENPTNATDRPIISLTAKVTFTKEEANKYPALNFWPTILQWNVVTLLVLFYSVTATAIGILMWKSMENPDHNFRLGSENVHMISRYFPSIVGTVTVIFFRLTIRETLRMVPFINMADKNGIEYYGSESWRCVGGSWFPWQSITTTPKSSISIISLFCQLIASFIVSLKVALFASTPHVDNETNNPYWILTVRLYPAALLIAGYVMMILYTLYISFRFRGRSTGLKWNPESIADYAALFSNCNALKYFAPLELRHHLRPKHVMLPNRLFRLGYWTRVRDNPRQTDIVYGIGVGFSPHIDTGHTSLQEREPLGQPWQHKLTFRKRKPHPIPVDQCNKRKPCSHGTWPKCEHYPYNYNPGCARWVIALASLLPIGALTLSIYALIIQLPNNGFSFPNSLKVPSSFHYGFGTSNHHLPPIDPADPNSTVLLWALMFRSAPTYVAGLFTSTIIEWIDLNMRFMQPFRNMFGEDPEKITSTRKRLRNWVDWRSWAPVSKKKTVPFEEQRIAATAAESILLSYLTLSPIQVPLTAWNKGHYRVCIYSTLNALSPLFPIFVGGLLAVSPDPSYERVNFQFSMSAYIGVMVSLVLYSILLPAAIPGTGKLLPRQLYSLADLMALCHESKFIASPHLNIADSDFIPSKQYMEARLLLTDDRFLFGVYQGRDGKQHIGFDIAQTRDPDSGHLKTLFGSVKYVPPEGLAARFRAFRRTTTIAMMEEARKAGKAMSGAVAMNGKNPFAQKAHDVRPGEEYQMSGGLARAETSGSEAHQSGNQGRTRPTRFDQAAGLRG